MSTYYVALTGNDINPGTIGSPFRSIAKGMAAAQPGDIVLVGAGVYNLTVSTVRTGTAAKRITLDGQGVATIRQFAFKHAYNTLQNCRVAGMTTPYQTLIQFKVGAHFCRALNNTLNANLVKSVIGIGWSTGRTKPFDLTTASDCVVEGNTLENFFAATLVSVAGDRNLVHKNILRNSASVDFFRLFGRKNILRGNKCTNNYQSDVVSGYHPDFIQTFGDNGHGSQGHIIEANIVNGVEGQLTQLSNSLVPEIGDWIFRNNIFMNVTLQASCTIPNVHYYHNIFYRCNTSSGAALNFGKRTYAAGRTYSGAAGVSYAHGCKAKGNVFLECGDGRDNVGWYGFSTELTGVSADHNYVGLANGEPVRTGALQQPVGNPGGWEPFRWWEDNGINGSDPRFVDAEAGDFRLLPDSPLIDAGIGLPEVPTDFNGAARGSTPDIGAFEL